MRAGTVAASLLAALSILASVSVIVDALSNNDEEIKELRSQISLLDSKKMYADAALKYQELVKLDNDNLELLIEYKDYCKEHNFDADCASACVSILRIDPTEFQTAKDYLAHLQKTGSKDIYKFVQNRISSMDGNDQKYFLDVYDNIKGSYKLLNGTYSEIDEWHTNYIIQPAGESGVYLRSGSEQYCFAKTKEGLYCVANHNGSVVLTAGSEKIYSFSPNENYVALMDDEQLVYVSPSDRRRVVPYDYENSELIYYDFLGAFSNGVANFNGKNNSGFINRSANIILDNLEATTTLSNNVAAVKSNGKWCFIKYDSKNGFSKLTDYIYDDIFIDEYGYALSYGYGFVKKSGSSDWSLIRTKMNEEMTAIENIIDVGNLTFDGVKPFGRYGAVKKGDKWGYIDENGEWLIQPVYDNAKSFGSGFAPVLIDDKWGYVDKTGKLIIDAQFEEANPFNQDGIASVKTNGMWKFIQLLEYAYK